MSDRNPKVNLAQQPVWDRWHLRRETCLWRAVVLSLDADPFVFDKWDEFVGRSWEYSGLDIAGYRQLLPEEAGDRLGSARRSVGPHGTLEVVRSAGNKEQFTVNLDVFVRWAVEQGWRLPLQMFQWIPDSHRRLYERSGHVPVVTNAVPIEDTPPYVTDRLRALFAVMRKFEDRWNTNNQPQSSEIAWEIDTTYGWYKPNAKEPSRNSSAFPRLIWPDDVAPPRADPKKQKTSKNK